MPCLDVIGVIVSDMERAVHFYERLGLRFPEDPDPEGHGHVETTLPEGLRFTLDTEESVRSFDPGSTPPKTRTPGSTANPDSRIDRAHPLPWPALSPWTPPRRPNGG